MKNPSTFKVHENGGTDHAATNLTEVRRFLEAFTTLVKAATEGMTNPGLLQIGQVNPLTADSYVPTRYKLDDVERMIADAIAFSDAGNNVYIEGRTVRTGLRGRQRGTVEDTVAVFAVVADDDGDKDEATEALPIEPTLLVESSPGNTHPWFFLTKAVPAQEGVALGRALKAALGGDYDTGTLTQPFRVCGTVNYPTPSKIERGRVAVPTRLLSATRAYTIEELNTAFPPVADDWSHTSGDEFTTDLIRLAATVEAIPNDDLKRGEWNRIGMAIWHASEGSKEGCDIFVRFSKKSKKCHDRGTAEKRWQKYFRSPPTRVGYGTLHYLATQADPDWERRLDDENVQALFHHKIDPESNIVQFWNKKLAANGSVPIEETAAKQLAPEETEPASTNNAAEDNGPVQQKPDLSKSRHYELVRASDIVMRAKNWLWRGHLLRGALELTTGIKGLGKSQLQCNLVASATTGGRWPDGSAGIEPVNVIMITAEDTLDQEVKPRLTAAGADLDRIYILKKIKRDNKARMFLLSEDIEALAGIISDVGGVGLVTLDPITAYMGKVDSHRTTDVRSQLGPLAEMAERTQVAFSSITHPPKAASQHAIDHFIGSQAFIAAARIGHLCIEEMVNDEPTGRKLFTNVATNASEKMPTLAYRINTLTVGQDPLTRESIVAPYIVWEEGTVSINADQAVAAAQTVGRAGRKNEAKEFLEHTLAKGPRPIKEIEEEAIANGFSKQQLRRAKAELKIKVKRVGTGIGSDSHWTWELLF